MFVVPRQRQNTESTYTHGRWLPIGDYEITSKGTWRVGAGAIVIFQAEFCDSNNWTEFHPLCQLYSNSFFFFFFSIWSYIVILFFGNLGTVGYPSPSIVSSHAKIDLSNFTTWFLHTSFVVQYFSMH